MPYSEDLIHKMDFSGEKRILYDTAHHFFFVINNSRPLPRLTPIMMCKNILFTVITIRDWQHMSNTGCIQSAGGVPETKWALKSSTARIFKRVRAKRRLIMPMMH